MTVSASFFWICSFHFAVGYGLNIFYITVLYHRGLAHGAVKLRPRLRKWVIFSGNWVTGLDPKGWVCMHRLHHAHSDTAEDPHSPIPRGIWSVFFKQLSSYRRVLVGLERGRTRYTSVVADLEFPIHFLNRRGLWYLPYLLHSGIGLGLGLLWGGFWPGVCYWIGIMSHPVQGWMVNALAHRFGYRLFKTPDHSRNNTIVAWLAMGEGYQNNHHHRPQSPKFSVRWWEVDLGFGLCWLARKMGGLDF